MATECPSAISRLSVSGALLTRFPTTKNVPCTPPAFRASRICTELVWFGPSSKVRKTIFSGAELGSFIHAWTFSEG